MGKVLKVVAGVALIGASFFVPAGGLFGVALLSGGTILAAGASLALSALAPRPRIPEAQLSRLNIRMDAGAPRKMVFGTTAFPLDLRYHEATGTDQEYIHYIIAHAAHKVKSIDSIYFEQDLAWTSGGGVTPKYSGYLTVTTRTEGAAGNEVSISSNWGTGERLTGCAYTYIRIKRTGNSKKSESPLVSGLPSRVTVIGEGIPLYDPRLDSTVTGGSGAHRTSDQTTWGLSYSPADSYDNTALQILTYLLGWEINGKLSVGCGVPAARIDLESFIEAANICDESIALDGGGTQARYRSSGAASDADDRMEVINTFLTACNGTLRDTGGKLSLTIMKDDLANYVLDFDDNDLLEDFTWQQTRGLTDSYNVARGRFVDPSTNSLYQLIDYPEVSITPPDGIDRVLRLDLALVEDGKRAQRIAKQVLQRNQYRGTFQGVFTAKALGCDVGEVIRLSLETLGWTNKLFRVTAKEIGMDGRVPMTLIEENAAIYAWSAEESAVVTATAPTVYNPLNSPFILSDDEVRLIAQEKIRTYLDESEPQPVELLVGDPASDSPSLSLDFAGAFNNGDVWFTPTSKLVSRWDADAGQWDLSLADITKSISGAASLVLNYDSGGTITTALPKLSAYQIAPAGGSAVTSGVTWAAATRLITGQSDSDYWSGTVPSISSGGMLSINSGLKVGRATVDVTATIGGVEYPAFAVEVNKVVAAATPATGGDFDSASISGTTVNSTTFTELCGLTVTTGASSTSVALTAAGVAITPNASPTGSVNIEFKWQYESSPSTWTDVATASNSSPDPNVINDAGEIYTVDGEITCGETQGSLSSSTSYNFRLMARNSSGTRLHTFSGTASAQG